MFEDLRNAWREAVENFYRELHGDEGVVLSSMRRDYEAAMEACRRVERERDRASAELGREREEELVARRRGDMAQRIGDRETVEVALRYADRHAKRVVVLQRVVAALSAEIDLRGQDVTEMKAALLVAESTEVGSAGVAGDVAAGAAESRGTGGEGPRRETGHVGASAGSGDAAGHPRSSSSGPGSPAMDSTGRSPFDKLDEPAFRDLEKRARERQAEELLSDLKRRMQ